MASRSSVSFECKMCKYASQRFFTKDDWRNWRTNDSPRNQLLKAMIFLVCFSKQQIHRMIRPFKNALFLFGVVKTWEFHLPPSRFGWPVWPEGQRLWWRAARRSKSADGCRTALWCRECFCCLAAGGRCFFILVGVGDFWTKIYGSSFFWWCFFKIFCQIYLCTCMYMFIYVYSIRKCF